MVGSSWQRLIETQQSCRFFVNEGLNEGALSGGWGKLSWVNMEQASPTHVVKVVFDKWQPFSCINLMVDSCSSS
jgi:hypothetical protein